ncbi:MAG: hypothetical protein IT267_07195 [Saprospiraceae bacterium]|nr:hypothetical protein [Saprospiraceae bacterium]
MSQEIERKNIGEKLHEDVAPLLFLSLMDINSLLEINNFAYYKQLQPTSINLLDAINKIRNISHLIHPAAINSFGFIHGILDFSSIINKSQGCKMSINRINDELSLDKFRQIMLFRIVQELTMNSIIHGSAKKINVNIEDNKSNISIIISHNGMMYSNEDYKINLRQNGSLGLKNIQQRLDLLEGKLSFGSNDIKTMQIITLIIPN